MDPDFELLLFATEPNLLFQMEQAGVNGFIVDWESLGKEDRQSQADTQINHDTIDDLERVRSCTRKTVVCRLNSPYAGTPKEVNQAIQFGADEILIPMVRTEEEVLKVLRLVEDKCRVGILIETVPATLIADRLNRLPLSRVFVGLNDLAIDRHSPHLFSALVDGTLEKVREQVSLPFGFGGITLPESGSPIPCRLLIGELVRLQCNFTFMRRSFLRDIRGRDPMLEIPRIRDAIAKAQKRSSIEVSRDHQDLLSVINATFSNSAGKKA